MSKRDEINTALKTAMRNKDTVAVSTIRLILAAIKERDISARGEGKTEGLSDADIAGLLQTMIKQREESASTYDQAGRVDLAERERAEKEVIRRFLPRPLSEEEVEGAVDRAIAETGAGDMKQMGQVMAYLKAHYAGQIDFSRVSTLVRSKLGQG